MGVEEYLQAVEQAAGTERDLSLNRVRVRVHENPHAKVPLIGGCSMDRLMSGMALWRALFDGVKFISEVGSPSLRNYLTQPSFLADRDCLLCAQLRANPRPSGKQQVLNPRQSSFR